LAIPNRLRDIGIESTRSPPSVLGSWIFRTVFEIPGSRVLDLRREYSALKSDREPPHKPRCTTQATERLRRIQN